MRQLAWTRTLKQDPTRRRTGLKMYSPNQTEQHQRTEVETALLHHGSVLRPFLPASRACPFFSGCSCSHVPLSQSVHLPIRLLAELCHPFISSQETKGRIH